jgi:hypothetical protein
MGYNYWVSSTSPLKDFSKIIPSDLSDF